MFPMNITREASVWIAISCFWILFHDHFCEGAVCTDGATYGYTDEQEPSIVEDNTDSNYLTGNVWYSSTYGRFDCCGLITAFDVKVSYDGYLEFQVWNVLDPVTTTATFKANYRTYVASNGGVEQRVTLPLDRQMPVREGDALGWISELFDSVRWSADPLLVPAPDSDYLWEDFSSWGYYNYTYTFAYHPESFSTLDNKHTFAVDGGENRVFGIRAVVNPGNTAKFDELPLNIAIYTTSHVVGDVVYTVLYSGGTTLEMAMYVKLDVTIYPDDGHLIWDGTTGQVKVGADLTTAMTDTPYTVTITIYDGCHDNNTADLKVYVFDDRPKTPVCTSGQQIAIPPSAFWDQTQEETVATGVALVDPRWRIPFNGVLEAVEVCVTSSPADIELQIWRIVDIEYGLLEMLAYQTITVTDTGCPATKVTLPVADQIPVVADLVIGWREANGNPGVFTYHEGKYLPATDAFLWVDLSAGLPYDYDVTGNPFQFDDAGFFRLNSFRDYGFRFYIGPGESPVISGLPAYMELKVGDFFKDDVITSFTYNDPNLRDILTMNFTLSPATGEFIVNETDLGSADVLLDADDLEGLEGMTFVLLVVVSDGCTSTETNLTIDIYIDTTTAEVTTTSEFTTTSEVTTTTEPATTPPVLGQADRRPLTPMNFWKTPIGYAVIAVCTGLGLAIIGTIIGLGRMCCKYFGAKNMVYNLRQNQSIILNNQLKQIRTINISSNNYKMNNLQHGLVPSAKSLTPPGSSTTPRVVTPRNINFAWHY